MAILTGAMSLLLLCCGGAVAVALVVGGPPPGPDEPAAPSPSPTPSSDRPETTPSPVVQVRTVTETEQIPFERRTVEDPTLPEGTEQTRIQGVAGEKELTYEVTLTDGVETGRELVSERVVREPVTEVVATGTGPVPEPEPPPEPEPEQPPEPERAPEPPPEPEAEPPPEPEPECDPNYEGACVPVAEDVDCAGGSGDGPEYVEGPVRVVGDDIYDLDRDGDGVACE